VVLSVSGIAANGYSVIITNDLQVIKEGCAKSFAPFPTGIPPFFLDLLRCYNQARGT